MSDILSKRERQIMDALHELSRATAHDIREALLDPPSYSAVRALLAVMERKGLVKHEQEGLKYVYLPTVNKAKASKHALSRVLEVFFGGSPEKVVAALVDKDISADELERIEALVRKARKAKGGHSS